MRSFIFNEILAKRINQGLWGKTLEGDVLDDKQLPTGTMWGRGRVSTTDAAQALENSISEKYTDLCEGLEHAGLSQERRSLVAMPEQFKWEWLADDVLRLNFSLPAGCYATSVIGEILQVTEPERLLSSKSATYPQ